MQRIFVPELVKPGLRELPGLLVRYLVGLFICNVIALPVSALDFPYAINVDELNCEGIALEYSCKPPETTPVAVAQTHELGCGYFKDGKGPVNNRWFDQCDPAMTGGYAKVCVYGRDNRLGCGLVDADVNVVIPLVYNELRLVNNVSVVAVNYLEKWGYYSLTQRRLLFTPQFSYVSDFGDGVAYVIDAGEEVTEPAWIIDDQGLRVAPVSQKIKVKGHFANGLIPARLDRLWGYLGTKGAWVIKPQFLDAGPFSNGIAAVKYESRPDQWALINEAGAGLIFFEGQHHQLNLKKQALAELSIQCDSRQSGELDFPQRPPESGGLADQISDFDHPCLKICFKPLEKGLKRKCR